MQKLSKILSALFVLCALVATTTVCIANQSKPVPATSSVAITPAPDNHVQILSTTETKTPTPTPKPVPTPTPPRSIASPDAPKQTPTPTPKPAVKPTNAPTVTEVANDYLDGTGNLSDYYTVKGEGWIQLKGSVLTGIQYDYLCPSAVFPEDNWTPEKVIQSYKDQSAPWVDDPYQLSFDSRQSLWSADYQYHFVIDDGWLVINGAYNTPFDCTAVEDITPQAVIEMYQSGEWDGEGKLWSSDYGTSVQVGHNQTLRYSFKNLMLICSESARQYAYTGCHDAPWWHNGVDGPWHKYQGFTIDEYNYNYTGNKCHYGSAQVTCYLDLPDGKIDPSLGQIVYITDNDDGTWVVTTNGIYDFQEGKLLDSWKLKMDAEKCFMALKAGSFNFAANYAYTGEKLVKLLPGGKTSRVLSGNIFADSNYESTFWAYRVQKHRLTRWRNSDGEISTSTLVDGNVVDLRGTDRYIFFTMEDGYTYGAYSDDYKFDPVCIGRISLDAVIEEWTDQESDVERITLEWLTSKYAGTITDTPTLTSTTVQDTTAHPHPSINISEWIADTRPTAGNGG